MLRRLSLIVRKNEFDIENVSKRNKWTCVSEQPVACIFGDN
jgi:hypothetical protein